MVIVSRRQCAYKQLFCVDFGLVLIKNIALGFLNKGINENSRSRR